MHRVAAALRFVRFPLVWTVVADVLAGAAVAMESPREFTWAKVWPLLVISPALYLFGMAMNDLLDLPDDRRAGRDRPLARGQMSARAGTMLAAVLLGLALMGGAFVNAATLLVIGLLLGAIAVYNTAAKRWMPTALLFMAACRALNVLVGWSAIIGDWRFDIDPHGPFVRSLLGAIALLTAVASLASGLEKRYGSVLIPGVRPSALILSCLLALPLADCLAVYGAWGHSLWAALWLAAIPLVAATSAVLRASDTRLK